MFVIIRVMSYPGIGSPAERGKGFSAGGAAAWGAAAVTVERGGH